jgi:FMN phosphatase YigB (HAD superfamily)
VLTIPAGHDIVRWMTHLALFALDDTLVDFTGGVFRWTDELIRERNLGPEADAWFRAEQERPVSPTESFAAIVEQFGLPETGQELQAAYTTRSRQLMGLFDGVIDGLVSLKAAGWRTGIVTDGHEPVQRSKFADGLETYVDTFCFAEDDGCHKPSPEIFNLAAERAGVSLDGGWMVGDSLSHDIAGAANVGLRSIWVSHGKPLPKDGVQPDFVVQSTAEAFPIMLHPGA